MGTDAESMELVLEALRRSEQRYRSLVEATASFVWIARPDGQLVSDMPRWRQITGQTTDELLGSGWLEAIHPDDRPGVQEAWDYATASSTTFAAEYRIRHREGGWRHLFVRGTPVFAEDGHTREIVGLCIDVTDRAELAVALEQERAVLQGVVDEMPVGVALLWGPDQVYRMVNRHYYDLVPAQRLLGRPLRDAAPEVHDAVRILVEPAYRGDAMRQDEVRVDWPAGERFYRVSATPVTNGTGGTGGVLLVAVETTDEVRRRETLERRLADERSTARTLQRALLPERLPETVGIECAVRYRPSGGELLVGGDFYDVLDLGVDGRVGVVVGDIAGRGVHAAAAMGQLRAAVRAYAVGAREDPASVVARTADFFWRFEPGEMATLVYGVADAAKRTVRIATAGHLPALVIVPGEPPRLARRAINPPLGARTTRYANETIGPLPPGSTVVLYTDGLVERRSEAIDVGLERLRRAAERHEEDPLEVLCDHLVTATGEPVREDDVALLAVRFA